MLSKHEEMGKLGYHGKSTTTGHRIDLHPESKPITQARYCQEHKARDMKSCEMAKVLEAGVIEHDSS